MVAVGSCRPPGVALRTVGPMTVPIPPPEAAHPRPWGLVVASVATAGFAVFFVVMAGLSLAGGHGEFSGHIALGLVVWALLVGVAAVVLWRRLRWARGPVVAVGLLHLLAFGQSTLVTPWAAVGALAALLAVVGALWPSTQAALGEHVAR